MMGTTDYLKLFTGHHTSGVPVRVRVGGHYTASVMDAIEGSAALE